MNLRDFRVGARLLKRDPGFSIVAIAGLAISLAMSLLLFGYARHSFTYDAHVPDVDNVYVVKTRKNLDLGQPWFDLGAVLLQIKGDTAPGVANATGYANWLPITVHLPPEARKVRSLIVLPHFAEILGLEAASGDVEQALESPDAFALTESAARRLFGSVDVVGRSVPLTSVEDMKCSARVGAVLRDPPANTTIPFDLIHGRTFCLIPGLLKQELSTGEFGWPANVLVHLQPGASIADLTQMMQREADNSTYVRNLPPDQIEKLGDRKAVEIKLSPLRDAYFDREVAYTFFALVVDRGNEPLVLGLIGVAVILLALAAFNYVNLATIRVIRRQREIGMRKALGAGRRQLALLFVAESLLVSMLATAIGIALALAALPAFGALVNHDLAGIITPVNLLVALGVGALLGVLSALYPAWIAFGVRPAHALSGRGDTESLPARRLRQSLSVLQIGGAMALASVGLAVFAQTRFATNVSPGFDPEPLLVFEINEGIQLGANDTTRNFLTALAQQRAVAGVALSTDAVGRTKNRWSAQIRREGGVGVRSDVKSVGPAFFEVYGVQPLAGRLFTSRDRAEDSVPVVLNVLAARLLGFDSPEAAVGHTLILTGDNNKPATKRIVGIAPDIRFYSLREPPAPIAYELWSVGATVTVRASGSLADAHEAIRNLWTRYFPTFTLDVQTARGIYAENYASDARLARLLTLATAIALGLAFFGAYAVAADSVQRRTREIALRKLFGARRRDIGRLVAREMALLVAVAALIGLPLAAISIARYLAPYTERTAWAYPALALALLAASATIAFAAARHAREAMRLRPAVALR